MTVEQSCPACGGFVLHATVSAEGVDDPNASDCTNCGWLRWPDDDLGCDRCRLHWRSGAPDRRGYSVGRAALLLGVSREELMGLLVDNPQLRCEDQVAPAELQRVPVHGLAVLLS